MPITHLTSLPQLTGVLSQSREKLTVIDFHASWCGVSVMTLSLMPIVSFVFYHSAMPRHRSYI